jgi:hypothetical protein
LLAQIVEQTKNLPELKEKKNILEHLERVLGSPALSNVIQTISIFVK